MMELTNLERVQVSTFHERLQNIQVIVCVSAPGNKIAVSQIHRQVCKELDLAESSWFAFTLVKGHELQCKVLPGSEYLTLPIQDLSLQWWLFDADSERRLHGDATAMHLLYCQAKHMVQTGKVKLSPAEQASLQGSLDNEELFYSLYRALRPSYGNVIHGCELTRAVPELQMREGSVVSVTVFSRGLCLSNDDLNYFVHWTKVISWCYNLQTKSFGTQVVFKSNVRMTLIFTIEQVEYFLSVMQEHIKQAQRELCSDAVFFAEMQRTKGQWIEMENALFSCEYPAEEEPGYVTV